MTPQGIVNSNFTAFEIRKPKLIPKTIPVKAPNCAIMSVSVKNCRVIECLLAPKALRIPISLVRSVTDTNIILSKAIDEPNIVIIPIIKPAAVSTPVMLPIRCNRSSLRSTPKLFSCIGVSPLILRISSTASSTAASNLSLVSTPIFMVKLGIVVEKAERAIPKGINT